MNTNVLEYIIAVAEQKSISAAADIFYLSQPVLSRHIKRTEERIGTKLFYYKNNEMQLTDAGKIYISNAKAILYAEQKLTQELNDLKLGRKRTLRIVVDSYLRSFFNRYIVSQLQAALGKRELIVSEGNVFLAQEALQSGNVDLAIVKCGNSNYPDLTVCTLFQDEIVMALPARQMTTELQQRIADSGLTALQNQCFVMERTDPVMRQQEQLAMNAHHLKPWMVREVSGSSNILEMVRQERGVAFLPKSLCACAGEEITVIELNQPFQIAAVFPGSQAQDEISRQSLRILREQYLKWNEYLKMMHAYWL